MVLQCSFDNDYRFVPGCSRGNLVPASDEEGQFVSFAESEFAEAAADGAWQINESVYQLYDAIKSCGSINVRHTGCAQDKEMHIHTLFTDFCRGTRVKVNEGTRENNRMKQTPL